MRNGFDDLGDEYDFFDEEVDALIDEAIRRPAIPGGRRGAVRRRVSRWPRMPLPEVWTAPSIPRSFLPRPWRIIEDEFDFGSPRQPRRQVRANFVSCDRPSAAIRAITGPDPVGTIRRANSRAIELLDYVINELEATRQKIVAGAAPASTVADEVNIALEERFHMDANDRNIWTGRGNRSVYVLIRRFRGARQILADGWMKYTCLGPAAPATVTIHRGGKSCTVEGCAGEVAFTCGGNSRIVLCEPFWRDSNNNIQDLDFQASTLLHECFHIYFFGVIRDQQKANIANAHCYEQFVLDLNFLPVPEEFKSSCP